MRLPITTDNLKARRDILGVMLRVPAIDLDSEN